MVKRLPRRSQGTSAQAAPRLFESSELISESVGSNWIHSSLSSIVLDKQNFAIVACADINEGERLIVYGGKVLTMTDYENLPSELMHFPYQIDDDLFIGPSSVDDVGIGERLNHSCDPTAGFQGEITLIAIRHISSGELITVDYATCASNDHTSFDIECMCGEKNCRKKLTGQDWKRKDIQARLFHYYQPYLQRKVRRDRKVKGLRN